MEISQLPPTQQAWSVIDWVGLHLSILAKRALKPPSKAPILIHPGMTTTQANDGTPLDMDAVLGGTEQYLRMAVSMLAYENGWWDDQGKLCLPSRNATKTQKIKAAGGHLYLASIWDALVDASETLRYWGENINIGRIQVNEGSSDTVPALLFDLNLKERLYFLIARMRTIQLEISAHMSGLGFSLPEFKNPDDSIIPLPPKGFVSFAEIETAVLLDLVYHYEIDSSGYSGDLSPAKLIRGYAVLKHYYEAPIEDAQIELASFDRNRIVKALQNCSLSTDEAQAFLNSVSFGRDSRDFFDCPVIRTKSGDEFILQAFVQFSSMPKVVVSRLNSLQVKFESKGSAFEQQVLELFAEHEIPARGFEFVADSEIYQFDVVVVWGECVFILECKNYLLPSSSPAQEFHFMESMDEAIEQVLRLKSALEKYPSQLENSFPNLRIPKKIIPVVLNAMPFSMDSQRRGVFLYDYSALSRFFGGSVSVTQPITVRNRLIQIEHEVKRLWAGTSPEPSDLIAQLTNPIQLDAELPRWYTESTVIGINDRVVMQIPTLRQRDTSHEDMLKALKVDEGVTHRFERISDELHKRLTKRRKQGSRKKRNRKT